MKTENVRGGVEIMHGLGSGRKSAEVVHGLLSPRGIKVCRVKGVKTGVLRRMQGWQKVERCSGEFRN